MTIPTDGGRGASAPRDPEPLIEALRQAKRALGEATKAVDAAMSALDGHDGDLPNPRDGTLLSVGEAARLMKCSEKTIQRRMKSEPDLVHCIGLKRMVVREVLLTDRSGNQAFG